MKFRSKLLNLFFPPKCVFCRSVIESDGPGICPDCRKGLKTPEILKGTAFRCCVSALPYDPSVRRAIARFKFEDHPEYAKVFGPVMAEEIKKQLQGAYDLITWVPVSRKRLKKRGYDQTQLLGEAALKNLGEELTPVLRKVKNNPAQSGMENSRMRRENVRGVYQVKDPKTIAGKRVLLIDDIVTTGATLEEAASTLLTAGARSVVCAALAHPARNKQDEKEQSL